jgi:hypothetical protein
MADERELRPAYRTLDDPVRFLGLSLAGWIGALVAAGVGYGWLLVSPLGWRPSVSVAVIALGGPTCLLLLREPSTVGPARLLAGVLRWRLRCPRLDASDHDATTSSGGVRLETTKPPAKPRDRRSPTSVWPSDHAGGPR